MITVPFTGQWGNQAFCYVLGKILAERTGQDYFPERTWKKKDGTPVRYSTDPPFVAQPQTTIGRGAVAGPTQHLRSLHWVDINGVDPNRSVHVESYCQRYELIQPYKDRIRNEWLKLNQPFTSSPPESVVMHVRRTDYVGDNLNPDQQCIAHTVLEFLRCLDEFPVASTIRIVTDDWNDPFIGELKAAIQRKTGLVASGWPGSWDEDFMTMASARRLIISQSTFSWWAGFLGRAEKIVCPISPNSLWGRGVGLMGPPKPGCGDYPNLHVFDEKRWVWLQT